MKALIIILFLVFVGIGQGIAQRLSWIKPVGGSSTMSVNDTEQDDAGNTYVCGNFSGQLLLGCTTLTANQQQAVFIAKLAVDGSCLWVRQDTGSMTYKHAFRMALDKRGRLYVAGAYPMLRRFEAATGKLTWAYQPPANSMPYVLASAICLDAADNLYLSGLFDGPSVEFGSVTAPTLTSSGLFVAKCNANGVWQWAHVLNSQAVGDVNLPTAIAVDGNGSAYVTGNTNGNIFNANLSLPAGISFGRNTGYAAKCSAAGFDYLWPLSTLDGSSSGFGIGATQAGEAYFSGSFCAQGTGAFETFYAGSDSLPVASGNCYNFLLKLGATGNLLWKNLSLTETSNLALDTRQEPYVLSNDTLIHFLPNGQIYSRQPLGIQRNLGPFEAYSKFDRSITGDIVVYGEIDRTVQIGNTTLTSQAASKVFIARWENSESILSGKVFVDLNANGIQDNGEPLCQQPVLLEVQPGPTFATSYTGLFETHLDTGHYRVSIRTLLPAYTIAPAYHTATFTGPLQADTDNNFALQPIANQNDLKIDLTPVTVFRRNFSADYHMTCVNIGSTTQSPVVTVTLDPLLTFNSSTPAPSSVSGRTLTWSLAALAPFQAAKIKLYTTLDQQAAIGTPVSTQAEISPVASDINPADNRSITTVEVAAAYDPNNKRVSPAGNITPAMVQQEQWLTYTLRFQNTGNDTAFYVLLQDTLHRNLQTGTFEVLATSHQGTWDLKGEGVAEFRFPGIRLPDSTTNEPASHGFVKYRVRVQDNLQLGEQITNTAHIFFDYNPAVATNTTVTQVSQVLATAAGNANLQASLYPNPASSKALLQVTTQQAGPLQVQLLNVLGEVMLEYKHPGAQPLEQELPLESLPGGLYLVRVNQGTRSAQLKLLVQH